MITGWTTHVALMWNLLNNVTFVTSTFSKTKILTVSLVFVMNVMVLP